MKVLVAPSTFGEISAAPLETLSARGYEVVRNPFGRRLTAPEVVELGAGCQGIVSGLEPLSREVLRALPKLRSISRCGSGLDNVDLEAAAELGIQVRSTPEAPVRAVAELTLGLIFDLLRGISRHDRLLRAGVWKKIPGELLQGKTVGVVGLGRIGRAVAELLRGLAVEVVGCDLVSDTTWAERWRVRWAPLAQLLAECDVVTLHVSRAPADPPLIGARELAAMKPGAFLLNLARGQAVDEEALLEALRAGRLGGAALDVFSREPCRGPLADLDRVVVTPHIGSSTRETLERMEREAVLNLIEALDPSRVSGERV